MTPPRKAPARKTTTTRKTTKRTPAKRTKATIEPTLTPAPEDVPEQPISEGGPSLDEGTRQQFRDQGLSDDQIDAILPVLGGIHAHGVNIGRYQARHDVAEDLRFLALARADYDQGNAPDPAEMDETQKAACIRAEHVACGWLAGIIELSKSPAGWLPSWRWSEWEARLAERGIEVKTD